MRTLQPAAHLTFAMYARNPADMKAYGFLRTAGVFNTLHDIQIVLVLAVPSNCFSMQRRERLRIEVVPEPPCLPKPGRLPHFYISRGLGKFEFEYTRFHRIMLIAINKIYFQEERAMFDSSHIISRAPEEQNDKSQ